MTVTFTPEQIYIGIIIGLMILQVVQWVRIGLLRKELDQVWNQIAIIAAAVSIQMRANQKQSTQEDGAEQQS